MNETLLGQIKEYFVNRQYDEIPTDSENVSMYGTYHKSNLYLINVIELRTGYGFDTDRYLEYKQLTMQQFAKNQADKIILLNIIISEETKELYEAFNYGPDLSEKFIDVLWIIDKQQQQLIIPKKQLKNILGIERDIKKMLNNERMSYYKLEPQIKPAVFTYIMIACNVLIWMMMEVMGDSTDTRTLIKFGAMQYELVVVQGEYYRLFTAMFLHIGVMHLFYNMFSLYIFGYRLERYLKRWQYAYIYILSGLIGSLSSMAGSYITEAHAVSAGASGAVYGLMGSLLIIAHRVKKPIDGVTSYIIWIMFVLGMVHSVLTPNVDIFAHIGGFIGGILITIVILKSTKIMDNG